MFAKHLEIILANLCQKSDVSHILPNEINEIAERFESLRGYRKLPYGRNKREQPLTSGRRITAAVFGLVSTNPKWAGHIAVILCDLRPVGGVGASFFGASTLRSLANES